MTDRGHKIAVTFFVIMCFVQIPLSIFSLSIFASFMRHGPASICLIAESLTEHLYSRGYEYDQINRLDEDEP